MATVKPVIHGRDHLPGGADPISGIDSEWEDVGGTTSSGIAEVTSDDSSVTITDPTGPVVDLAVYNSPRVGGIAVTGTPSTGKILIATSSSAAHWATPAAHVDEITSTDSSITVTDPTGPTSDLAVEDSPRVGGIAVTGTPAAGDILTATSSSAADWEAPAAPATSTVDFLRIPNGLTVTATTQSTADSYALGASISYSGSTRVMIECYAPWMFHNNSRGAWIDLWDNGSWYINMANRLGNGQVIFYVTHVVTPDAGSHQFEVKVWRDAGAGGVTLVGGSGISPGTGLSEGWFRITAF